MRALVASLLLAAVGLAADGPPARADAPAATPSATTPMLDHADPVASYTLRAKLDATAHTVHGEGTILWKNASTKPVSELWLHLYLNGFKNQSSTFMRAPVGGFRGTTTPEDWGAIDLKKLAWNDDDLLPAIELHRPGDADETDAHVTLPRPIAPGDTATFTMEWEDKLPSVVERTGHVGSFHMIAQWFPKIAKLEPDGTFAHFPFHHLGEFYADYGRYDVTLDVPKGYVVGASGPQVETSDAGDRHVERHVQSDVHDFAWTAWDRFQTRKERIRDVDVTILFPPGYGALAERELATMRFALPHFDARYGKYPYSVLTLVHPPENALEAGGMEYPTLITTGQSPSWMPPGLWFPEAVTIHEYGHQYFYGLVGSYEDRWPFLDEGLNSYAENESLRQWLGPASSVDFLGFQIGDVEAQAVAARHNGHNERIAQDAASFATGADYGALVYSRTATVLETMARVYGKPRFEHALGVYTRKWRFRHPTPDDLLAVIREELGEDAASNLRLALFDKGSIDLAVLQLGSSNAGPAAGIFDRDGKRETVEAKAGGSAYEGWALVVRRGGLRLATEVELVAEDGTRTRVPWDGQTETFRAPYHGRSPLQSAVVDPDGKILVDDDPTNNFASRRPTGAPRVFERALFWGATLLGGIGP